VDDPGHSRRLVAGLEWPSGRVENVDCRARVRFQAARTAGTQGSGLDDLEKAPAAAAHQASGGMQDAQGLRLGLGQGAVQDEQAELDQ
jgi:hypothetical protein